MFFCAHGIVMRPRVRFQIEDVGAEEEIQTRLLGQEFVSKRVYFLLRWFPQRR
jgi:hypothetical protein